MATTPKQAYSDMEAPPMAVPVAPDTDGAWKVPVTRASTNLKTDCCPCAALSDTMSRITTHGSVYGGMLCFFYVVALIVPSVLIFLQFRTSWNWVVVLVAALVLAAMVVAVARAKVRSHFGIPGNPLEDCFWSFFCMPYAIGQMKAQVDDVAAEPSTLPAYQA